MRLLSYFSIFLAVLATHACTHNPAVDNGVISAIKVSEFPSDVIQDWNNVFLMIEKHAKGYQGGPATRTLAYLGMSAYEGVVQGMPDFNSFDGYWPNFVVPKIESNEAYCWPLVINASFENLLPKFFSNARPEDLQLINNTYNKWNNKYAATIDEDVYNRSIERGKSVSEAVWIYAESDEVGHEHDLDPYRNYDWQSSYKKEGDWKPIAPKFELPIGGEWGGARTFSISQSQKRCRAPLAYSTSQNSDFFNQHTELMINEISFQSELNPPIFYSDEFFGYTFSYGLRFLSIGNQALAIDQSNLEKAVYMLAILGLAANDASVACWHSKYHYNTELPQSYIQRNVDATWELYSENPFTFEKDYAPPYPAYPSGHATIAAASSEALNEIFGNGFILTDNSHQDIEAFKDIERRPMGFSEISEEIAWSRVLLGYNLRSDCEEGNRFGKEIFKSIKQLPWKK